MIRTKDFIHPEDEAALRNLESIPGFGAAVKGVLKIGLEQLYHGLNMASKIRLSDKQLPDLYNRLLPICEKLGIEVPEFYLEMNPNPNAYTFGDTRVFLTVTSGLFDLLDDNEIDAVLAHECGHIACRHVLYHTMAQLLMKGVNVFGILGKLATPIQLGLLYWSRRSELSADRAAAAVMGNVTPVVESMMRLAGGPKSLTKDVDIELYAAQADAYDALKEKKWDKMLQGYAEMSQSHPFAAVRVKEIIEWGKTENFNKISKAITEGKIGECCKSCGASLESDWKFCNSCGSKI